jgi:N-acyl amino acid synthase of PEP-CTERM/exosortase system
MKLPVTSDEIARWAMSTQSTDFAPYFTGQRVLPADDAPMMLRVLSLRFDVYCLECGYLPAQAYADGLERDEHDAASAHFCALDRRDELAGCVRLVPADSLGRFPFQEHCPSLFEHSQLPEPRLAAEISRLMVHQRYRRRRGDTLAGVTITSDAAPEVERRNDSPQIMLSMFRQMYGFSLDNGTRYWYAAMERPLARALARLGFAFQQIGAETDYYGPVAPYLADLRELEVKLGEARPDLLTWMRSPMA